LSIIDELQDELAALESILSEKIHFALQKVRLRENALARKCV
jgi:hypothetical protein